MEANGVVGDSISQNQRNSSAGETPNGKNFSLNLILLSAAIALFLLAGGFLVQGYFFPSSDSVAKRMMLSISNLKTAGYQANGRIKIVYGEEKREMSEISSDFTSSGAFDLNDENNYKGSFNLGVGENQLIQGNLDLKALKIGKIVYAKIESTSPMLGSYFSGQLIGKWLEIDYREIMDKLIEEYPDLGKFFKYSAKEIEISKDQMARLRGITKDAKIFVIGKQLEDKNINNVSCRHYQADIDKDALRDYVAAAGAILDQVPQQQINCVIEAIGKINFPGIEIWISKTDFSLRRLKGEADYIYDSSTISLSGTVDFNNMDQPVLIVAPENPSSLYDILNEGTSAKVNARAEQLHAQAKLDDFNGEDSNCGKERQVLSYGQQCCAGLEAIGVTNSGADVNCNKTIPSDNVEHGEVKICAKCGNGICGPGENVCTCPKDCQVTNNKCAGQNEAIRGRVCCRGLEVKCSTEPLLLADGTTKMTPTSCWCVPE